MKRIVCAFDVALFLSVIMLVLSCGHARNDQPIFSNNAPVANADPDQNVATGSLVTLNGSGSSDANGDALTYSWSFTSKPAGSTATLSSLAVVNPTFTADKDGAYVFSLVVNDGTVSSTADTVTINAATANSAPVANAGPDQNVVTTTVVTLDGSGSSDANGDMLTYAWSFTSRPAGSMTALSSSTVANPTFTADKDGAYVLSLLVNDGQVNSAADTLTVIAFKPVPVPDTGQSTSYTTTFGEDADYLINPQSFVENGDETITDNITGLVWQKQDDGITRNWYDANTYCNSNSPGLPGPSWRLPSRMELLSIINYDKDNPADDISYFPNTKSLSYWTSITTANDTTMARVVHFAHGSTGIGDKTETDYVRCVRGGAALKSMKDNGDGTITDVFTTLMWQKQDDGTTKTWEGAIAYCENLLFATYSDWRLPNIKELSSLVDDSRYVPGIDTFYFPNTQASVYWSSTTPGCCTAAGWGVNFWGGDTDAYSKARSYSARCVR